MSATPDGQGYWFVASDGGIFGYGHAGFYGSTGAITSTSPIVGMARHPGRQGLLAGGLRRRDLRLRRRPFYGSTGNLNLNQPVVGMAADPDGKGYWLVAPTAASSPRCAGFYGRPATNAERAHRRDGLDPRRQGLLVGRPDGGVFAFGYAPFDGSLGGLGSPMQRGSHSGSDRRTVRCKEEGPRYRAPPPRPTGVNDSPRDDQKNRRGPVEGIATRSALWRGFLGCSVDAARTLTRAGRGGSKLHPVFNAPPRPLPRRPPPPRSGGGPAPPAPPAPAATRGGLVPLCCRGPSSPDARPASWARR